MRKIRKMKRAIVLHSIAILIIANGCGEHNGAETAAVSPAGAYISSVIECANHSESILRDMSAAADDAATRIMNGGRIFVTDDETIFRTGTEETKIVEGGGYAYPMHDDWGGFVAEACDRAGGLRHIKPVPVNGTLTDKDVVLVGTLDLNSDAQLKQLIEYKDSGALVIVFGSERSTVVATADHLIPNGLDTGIVPVMQIGGSDAVGPMAGIANVINLWTFTAEFVAAITRQGEMPTLWQSMFVPGAAERNEPIGEHLFHPFMRIMPIEPQDLGLQYISAVRDYLENIRSNELPKFKAAGKLCADTISNGGDVVASLIGHFMISQQRMPGYPGLFTTRENEYGSEQLEGILDGNDVWLHVGYSYTPERELNYANEIGAQTVCVFTPGPIELGEGTPVQPNMDQIGIYIDPYWKHGDAVVYVADYDTKIIPTSGVVMISCYWMLLGETMLHLKGDK
ncbi:hypothetical protein ACFL6P_05325 [Candidatus Latescibacterota bacterium]